NNGDGTFKDITNSSIVIDSSLTMTPVWIDYNNDGDLDLFVTNHCFPPCQDDTQNFLFLNDNGKFVLQDNLTIGLVEDEGNSASWADCDNDGDLDLYTTRNNNTSIYYTNNGDGKFSYQKENRLTDPDGTAGTWADYDNDGDLDIYTNNYGRDNFLYQNDGAGNFTKITNLTITKDSSFSSGSAWADYDNDGYLDLVLFCSRQTQPSGPRVNHLYKNNGDKTFSRILDGVIVSDNEFSHAGEWADYDRDGDLDLFVAQIRGEKNALYRNNGNDNNWVNIKLHGTKSNRSAIGAKVRIKAIINGKPVWQLREISSQSAFYAQSSLNAHFGLGDATMIDTIKIEWPSGIVEIKENENSNQFLIYTESK
ncbi:MAG: CRTAC1 family protein, partial [candidate division Zixibacteria bacterium]|nr:CRTAC1 family protein [candidate division Zixibacteria bacterium]